MFKVNVNTEMLADYTVSHNVSEGGIFEVHVALNDSLIGIVYGNNGTWRIRGLPHFESPHLPEAIIEAVSSYLTQMKEFSDSFNAISALKK